MPSLVLAGLAYFFPLLLRHDTTETTMLQPCIRTGFHTRGYAVAGTIAVVAEKGATAVHALSLVEFG